MTHFTPISFPSFNLVTNVKSRNYVEYILPYYVLSRIGIKVKKYLNIQCLEAWLIPNGKLEIHRDIDHKGDPNIGWSLVCSPIGHYPIIQIFKEPTNITNISYFTAVSGFKMPYMTEETAVLTEEWDMKNGACVFDAGRLWHSAVNLGSTPANLFSFRGKDNDSLNELLTLLDTCQ